MSELKDFEGHQPRNCGEHRTVGSHRAWCHDCGEWCYPESPCVRCEEPRKDALLAEAAAVLATFPKVDDADVVGVLATIVDWYEDRAKPLLEKLEGRE